MQAFFNRHSAHSNPSDTKKKSYVLDNELPGHNGHKTKANEFPVPFADPPSCCGLRRLDFGNRLRKPLIPVRHVLAPSLAINQMAEPSEPGWSETISSINAAPFFVCILGLATGSGILFWRRAANSARSLKQADDQGLVLAQPYFSNSLMTYLYSSITLDFTDSKLSNSALPDVTSIRRLVSLRVPGSEISKDCCAKIAKCDSLERLDLSNTKINDDGLALLSELKNLNMLNIDGTNISMLAVQKLLSKSALQWISIKGTRLTQPQISKLQSQFPETKIENLA